MSATRRAEHATRSGSTGVELRERELDALIVDDARQRALPDRLHRQQRAGARRARRRRRSAPGAFFTDFRYATQSAEQVAGEFEREIVVGRPARRARRRLARRAGALGFDEASLTVAAARAPGASCSASGWRARAARGGAVERLRAVKDERELARIACRGRARRRGAARCSKRGLAGRTEREVAIELELRMRRLGAQSPSFPSIVAAGAHGALPHAEPRDVEIPRDVLVTIDWGAHARRLLLGLHAHVRHRRASRAQAREVYELVLAAQQAGVAAVTAGRRRARGRRASRARSSSRPATASTSATASVTASAWRSTRRRGCRAPPASARSSPATS